MFGFDKLRSYLLGKPKTAGYRSIVVRHFTQLRRLPPFTFETVRDMLLDDTVRLGLAMRSAPLCQAQFGFKEQGQWVEGIKADRPEVGQYVHEQLQRLWRFELHKILTAQVWGWSAGEVVFKLANDRVEFDKLLHRHAIDVWALLKDGETKGVRFRRIPGRGSIDLKFPKCFWHAFDPEGESPYGVSVLLGAHSPWADKWLDGGALDTRRLFMHQNAYGGSDMTYPPGTTDTGGDEPIPNRDIAREITEQLIAGGTTTRPWDADPVSGKNRWELTRATVPSNPTHILEYPKDLDVEILRGMEIPDDVLTSEGTGAWQGKQVPMQAYFTNADRWLGQVIKVVVTQILEPSVLLNWGRAEEFEVKTKPLAEQALEQMQKAEAGNEGGEAQETGPAQPQTNGRGARISDLFRGRQEEEPQRGVPLPRIGRMGLEAEEMVGAGVVQASELVKAGRKLLNGHAKRMAVAHAPKGGVTIEGNFFEGGEFVPGKSQQEVDAAAESSETEAEDSGITVTELDERTFDGEPRPIENKPSKAETGRIGEQVAIEYLKSLGLDDARMMNLDRNNFPVDLIEDHAVYEVKAGLISNRKDAQKWRLTIGEPGKKEKAWLKTASAKEKADWNARKAEMIVERKRRVVDELSKQIGHDVELKTMTLILDPDRKEADIHIFEGSHPIIRWRSDQAKEAYVGTVQYG